MPSIASKISGYRNGDNRLLRYAFETWKKQTGGKMQFLFEPVKERADISCAWVSDQKELTLPNAVGVCWRSADGENYLARAEIKVLTSNNRIDIPSSADEQFRTKDLEEVWLHEIGHSLGLNHSSSENDVMWPHVHLHPMVTPSSRDLEAFNSLYVTNAYEYVSAAVDCIQSGRYSESFTQINKALAANPKDTRIRDALCIYLYNAGSGELQNQKYSTAIMILKKAREIGGGSISEFGWASTFIVRHKQNSSNNSLSPLFKLRSQLVSLSDEHEVTDMECVLPFKENASKAPPTKH